MAAIENLLSVVPAEHGDQCKTLLHILVKYSTHRWLSKEHLNIDGQQFYQNQQNEQSTLPFTHNIMPQTNIYFLYFLLYRDI